MRIWEADYVAKKLSCLDINFGNLKRNNMTVIIEPNDRFAYVGTKTGDIIEVNIDRAIYSRCGPSKKLLG